MCGYFLFRQNIPSDDRRFSRCGNYRSHRFAISWNKEFRTLEYSIGIHYGLGKALPKGEMILVPFSRYVAIGEPIFWERNRQIFGDLLDRHMKELSMQFKITRSAAFW